MNNLARRLSAKFRRLSSSAAEELAERRTARDVDGDVLPDVKEEEDDHDDEEEEVEEKSGQDDQDDQDQEQEQKQYQEQAEEQEQEQAQGQDQGQEAQEAQEQAPSSAVSEIRALLEWMQDDSVTPAEQRERREVAGELVDFMPPNVGSGQSDLVLMGKEHLTSLPEGLTVPGSCTLDDSLELRRLPAGFSVGGDCSLYDCHALEEVCEGFTVGGSLNCYNCYALLRLPAVLRVPEDLYLTHCRVLSRLPEGLHVGRILCVDGCDVLTALPAGLFVGSRLDLENSGVRSLPEEVLAWASTDEGATEVRDVLLGNSAVPAEELEALQHLGNPALRFHVSIQDSDDEGSEGGDALGGWGDADDFATLQPAADFWKQAARLDHPDDVRLPLELFVPKAYLRGVLTFMSKLRRAKEFDGAEARPGLARRVVEVLELLCGEDNDAREEVLVRMGDAVDTCGDKPVWALNQMQLYVLLAKARGDRAKLRGLGMGVMRLDVVHRHVRKAVEDMTFVDDVCVYLRFEIALREDLDLPVSALDMLYPSYITVTQESIDAAREEALEVTEDDLEKWLPNWSEWQRQDRVEFAEELDFSALKRNSTKRLSLSLRSLLGNKVADPVRVRPAKAVWSLADLMKHWINTGMDLNNTPRDVDYMRLNLTKCT